MTLQNRDINAINKTLTHRIICILDPSKILIVDRDKGFTGKMIQYILNAIKYQLLKVIYLWVFQNREANTNNWKYVYKTLDRKRIQMAFTCSICSVYNEYPYINMVQEFFTLLACS